MAAGAKTIAELVGKTVCVIMSGFGEDNKVLAYDQGAGMIKLQYEESDPKWYPIHSIEAIEETSS